VGAAVSCGDSSGPSGGGAQHVAVGDTIAGQLATSDTVRVYTFTTASDVYYAVFLQSITGYQALRVRYPGDFNPLAIVVTLPGRPLLDNASEVFWAYAAGELEIRVTKAASPEGSFRFLVMRVNRLPETQPASLEVGDTVSGEALATIADVDEFTFLGQGGQPVVAMLQAQGPTGSGTIQLDIIDPSMGRLDSVKSSGGDSTLDIQGTGVVVLPTTREYHANIRSLRTTNIADPNYEGPYRVALLTIDSAPELVPSDITIGDTVYEVIAPIGDVDAFHTCFTWGCSPPPVLGSPLSRAPVTTRAWPIGRLESSRCQRRERTLLKCGASKTVSSEIVDLTACSCTRSITVLKVNRTPWLWGIALPRPSNSPETSTNTRSP